MGNAGPEAAPQVPEQEPPKQPLPRESEHHLRGFRACKVVLSRAIDRAAEHNVWRLSAAFSFYALLSVAPFLVLAISVASFFLGTSQVGRLLNQAREIGGPKGQQLLQDLIEGVQRPGSGVLATVLSLAVTYFAASGLFMALEDIVNAIWELKFEGHVIKNILVARIVAFLSVIAFGALFVAWLIVDSKLVQGSWIPGGTVFSQLFSFLTTVVGLTTLFLITMSAIPRFKLRVSDAWPGALTAGFGIALTKLLATNYIGHTTTAYGAAGSVVVLLLWLYYSSVVYFFGVEITRVYAQLFGSLREQSAVQ